VVVILCFKNIVLKRAALAGSQVLFVQNANQEQFSIMLHSRDGKHYVQEAAVRQVLGMEPGYAEAVEIWTGTNWFVLPFGERLEFCSL
jgi:hypothetical protein